MASVDSIGKKPPSNWLHWIQIPPVFSFSHRMGTVFGLGMARPLLPVPPVLDSTLPMVSVNLLGNKTPRNTLH
jgi:hypothetical protein